MGVNFNGNYFYNPYSNYYPKPIKANFHAHSQVHLGLTNGSQPAEELLSHYQNNGYDIISLSNYQKISLSPQNSNYIPVYEHGYSIRKSHQLIINASSVSYFDFPVFQSYHHKQQVLKKLKNESSLIAIAHPLLRDGYNYNDFKYLKGYNLIEVFNNRKAYTSVWDEALSNGYLVWLIANDDTHDIRRTDHTFVSWTRIGVPDNSKSKVLHALSVGCHYGVRNTDNKENNKLDSCKLNGDTITVYFNTIAQSIAFISDGGVKQQVVDSAKCASYAIKPTDTYVRIEARSHNEIICLNPIVRYDGTNLPFAASFPKVDIVKTVLFRFMVLIVNSITLILFLALYPKLRRRTLRWANGLFFRGGQIKIG
jgi:hypothetical protein